MSTISPVSPVAQLTTSWFCLSPVLWLGRDCDIARLIRCHRAQTECLRTLLDRRERFGLGQPQQQRAALTLKLDLPRLELCELITLGGQTPGLAQRDQAHQ